MAKKINKRFHAWILFALAVLLLAAAWLMKSFPVLIFAALSPLFAISDQAKEQPSPWYRFELILIASAAGLWAAASFSASALVPVLLQAIAFTLVFVAYVFAHKNLGPKLGKFTVIFFWLGLEYLALKLPWAAQVHYLANALVLKAEWYRWTIYTGYLGVSLWILVANLLFYFSLFRPEGFSALFFGAAVVVVLAPLFYSLQTAGAAITSTTMLEFYTTTSTSLPEKYLQRGEWVARTAAWVSVLILMLAFVKNYTRKK
ncbi:MAG: hypothetical protein J0L66_07565 [Cytophagales bacterium]|nr:hypothetical protein [Cytophagales bacterium]